MLYEVITTWANHCEICATGTIDFRDVKKEVKNVLSRLDHTNLNEVPEFGSLNPTAENLAKFLYSELSRRLNTEFIKIQKIMVFESPGCGSSYQEI